MPGGINAPLHVILTWPAPNYENPVTVPKYVLIFSCIIGPFSIALLCARLWVRMRMQRNAGWDDWLMLAAAFPMLALTIIFPLVTEVYRFNRHVWDVEHKYFPIQRKFVMVIYILYALTSGLIKLSILLFYRRLSSRAVSPAFRWTMRITIFVIGTYSIAFMLVPTFMCRPISAFWDQVDYAKIAKGYKYTCINEGADVVAHGVVSTAQDLVVAFLPTILCWNLQLAFRQKVALYSIFALGYTSVAVGAMRTYQGYRLFFKTYDVTWVASDIWLWSLLELHIGCMCANAPAVRIFFEKVLKVDQLTSWTRSRSRSQTDGSKKQSSSKDNSANGDLCERTEDTRWFSRVFHRSRLKSAHVSQLNISYPRGVSLQSHTHIESRDSMTNPLASEHIDVILMHDESIEMERLSTTRSNVTTQALPPPQTHNFSRAIDRGPLELSQRSRSWDTKERSRIQEGEH